jgi:hypothetical protein
MVTFLYFVTRGGGRWVVLGWCDIAINYGLYAINELNKKKKILWGVVVVPSDNPCLRFDVGRSATDKWRSYCCTGGG